MKFVVEMSSVSYVPSIVKIGSAVQKLNGEEGPTALGSMAVS